VANEYGKELKKLGTSGELEFAFEFPFQSSDGEYYFRVLKQYYSNL